MKAKTKPVKGSARTQKFDRGGTVAALAGLGTLAYLMSRKKKGEAGKGMGKFPMEAGDGTSGPGMDEYKPKDDAAKQRALDQSKDPRSNYMPEDADRKVLYSDINAKRTDSKKTTTPVVKKTTTKKPLVAPAPTTSTTTTPKTTLDVVKTLKPGERGQSRSDLTSKPYPEKEAEANKVKNTPGVTVMKPSDKEIRDIKAKQAAPTGARRTRYAKKEVEEIKSNTGPKRTRYGKKDGGAVKKYADGGMTSSKPEPKKAPIACLCP